MENNLIINVLSQSSFILLNKALLSYFRDITTTVYLSEMIDKHNYLSHNENYDGWFFYQQDKIEKKLFINVKHQRKIVNLLKKENIIDTKKMGLPLKIYYKLNVKNIEKIIVQAQSTLVVRYNRPNCTGQIDLSNIITNNNNKDNKNILLSSKTNAFIANFEKKYKTKTSKTYKINKSIYPVIDEYIKKYDLSETDIDIIIENFLIEFYPTKTDNPNVKLLLSKNIIETYIKRLM